MAILAQVGSGAFHATVTIRWENQRTRHYIQTLFEWVQYEEPSVFLIADYLVKICLGPGGPARSRTQDALTSSSRPNLAT